MAWSRGGTVSVTKNSTTVTGTGTGFVANSRVGDAFLGPDGAWYEVANIASDTALSILPAYIGATASGAAYALAPIQGYTKASADTLRSLVNTYGSKLAALGTTGNYETLPIDKGGTGVAADSTATLLSGIGAMPVGGGSSVTPLFSSIRAAITGANPSASGAYIGWNDNSGSGMSGAMNFTCNQGGGTGGFTWRTVNSANTAGGPYMTLSYAGVLNVPGGIQLAGRNIVESGTTSAGTYVRYADGTQICYLRNQAFGPAAANATATASWTPPAAFASNVATVLAILQYAETSDAFTIARLNANMGSGGVVAITGNFSVSQVYRIGLVAIGRWY